MSTLAPPPAPPTAPRDDARAWVTPVAVGVAAAVGTVVLGVGDPNTTHVPLCPLHALTGLDCPLCGSLRAVHSLAHLDVVGALDHNLMFTLAAPALVVGWVLWLARSLDRPLVPHRPTPRAITVAVWTIAIAFGVIRNLPQLSWLASGA